MITLSIDWCLFYCLFCAFFVGQVGFCCNLDTARADGVFCELITWGRNVKQSCGSPRAALVWDVGNKGVGDSLFHFGKGSVASH